MCPTHPLIEITAKKHRVLIDLVYATAGNFTGRPIYDSPRCLLHRDAERPLKKAVEIAALAGMKLKVFDAYRPPKAQEIFWKHLPDPRYVADIVQGSNHSRGVAVDLTLVDEQGRELDMGTAFDTMAEPSHHFHSKLPPTVQKNRLLLLGIMSQAGFKRIDSEWWHYELPSSLEYPVIEGELVACHRA
jgi:D-alanyl-D-alanine dipeptidase